MIEANNILANWNPDLNPIAHKKKNQSTASSMQYFNL